MSYCTGMKQTGLRIGITYDLREDYLAQGYSLEETAELDKPETIDGIAGAREHPLAKPTDQRGVR